MIATVPQRGMPTSSPLVAPHQFIADTILQSHALASMIKGEVALRDGGRIIEALGDVSCWPGVTWSSMVGRAVIGRVPNAPRDSIEICSHFQHAGVPHRCNTSYFLSGRDVMDSKGDGQLSRTNVRRPVLRVQSLGRVRIAHVFGILELKLPLPLSIDLMRRRRESGQFIGVCGLHDFGDAGNVSNHVVQHVILERSRQIAHDPDLST